MGGEEAAADRPPPLPCATSSLSAGVGFRRRFAISSLDITSGRRRPRMRKEIRTW